MSVSRRLLSLAVIASLSLTGCSAPSDDAEAPETTTTSHVTTANKPEATSSAAKEAPSKSDSESSSVKAAMKAYEAVIATPSAYPVNEAAQYEPRGGYGYALVESTFDDTPELLLRVNGMEYSPVLVFSYGPERDEVVQTDEVLIDGAAGVGGSRSKVWASKTGKGIYQVDYHSLRTEAFSTLFGVVDTSLSKASDRVEFDLRDRLDDHQPILWFDTDDTSGFDIVQGVGGAAPGVEELTPYGTTSSEPDAEVAPADGSYRFSGEVVIMTNADLPEGPANGEPLDQEHIILNLDAPQEVTAQTPANSHRTATMSQVVLHPYNSDKPVEHSVWMPYVGQHITITSTPEQMSYPSDTSMPLGMLRVRDAVSID